MNKINKAIKLALLGTSTIATGMASAFDLKFQPRIEGGISNYEYEMDGIYNTFLNSDTVVDGGTTYSLSGSLVETQSNFKILDNIGFLGGGLTIFADKFFFDISAKKFLTGGDKGSLRGGYNNNAVTNDDSFHVSDTFHDNSTFDTDIDRLEYALALGYSVNNNISVFGGWKWAKTELDYKSTGAFRLTSNYGWSGNLDDGNYHTISGTSTGKSESKFEYDGPFLGTAYGLNIPEANGGLTFKFAVAFLDGKVTSKTKGGTYTITDIDNIHGLSATNSGSVGSRPAFDSKGDSVGWNFGVAWRGDTSVKGLGYMAGVDLYQYKFDAKDEGKQPNINERVVNFNLGVSYAF